MWVEGFWHNVCLTAHFINIALQSRIWTKMCQVYLKAECSSFLKNLYWNKKNVPRMSGVLIQAFILLIWSQRLKAANDDRFGM